MPGDDFPTIHVPPNGTAQGIIIRLGAKAAYLDLEVSDETGKPTEATAYFWRPDIDKGSDDWGISQTINANHKHFPVPPVPFGVTVEADGFEGWRHPGFEFQADKGLILLNSGQILKLSVRLRRAAVEKVSVPG
jgi:hypothetical protein